MTNGASVPAGRRAAILAPGGGYSVDGPLLMFARRAAEHRGASPYPVAWDMSGDAGLAAMVVRRTEAVLATVAEESTVLFGKSLGSYAAPVAADAALAAVWFTPLLADPATVAALRRASAPFLLVGGTADEAWHGTVARSLTPHVVEIPDADHGLFVPGPLAASASVLAEVATAVEHFLDAIVWPG